jgi:DNA-directed RNA polymerase subunit RPC12/RpoP
VVYNLQVAVHNAGRIMQFMERQLILDLKDITRIGVQCTRCNTRAVLDVTNDKCLTPDKCSSCGSEFYQDSIERSTPLDRLVKALREQQTSKRAVTFHITIPQLEV